MDAPASFGRFLRLRRKILDLTQDELARDVGCSVVTIRKLEADERRPSRQIAERLAGSLRVAAQERAAFISLARAEPYFDESPAPSSETQSISAHARPRTNLPTPLTRLIGRKADVAMLRNALSRAETRLVTLVGPPGIGKTRLAIQAATELRDAFADGVYFVGLAAIRDPALVVGAIGQALGLRDSSGQPLVERVQEHLREKRLLLVLDNFEQIVAAAPLVVEVLEGGSGSKALVTSRAALHVRGEQLIPVAPLPLPDVAQTPTPRTLAQNPAVALFVERAKAVMFAFTLTETNAPMIAELCARLDGLPLAIELVAARTRLLPPQALLAQIDQRLALLTDGPRDLPARHRTLRAALAGSYELLDTAAQALFRRLGVFVGGWTLEAATYIAGTQTGASEHISASHPLIAILSTLVGHSLVEQRLPTEAVPRFTMLETIGEYARELLAETGEALAVQRAHAAYFLELAEQAEPELHGPGQVAWLDLLELEHANLRAALTWAIESRNTEWALRLGAALSWFWYVRGYSSEGRRWLDRIVQGVVPAEMQAHTVHLARALYAAGHLALFQGDFAGARERLQSSVELWRSLVAQHDRENRFHHGLITALVFLCLTAQYQGDMDALATIQDEYAMRSTNVDDARMRAMLLFNQGRGALLQYGDHQAARPYLEQSLALLRPLGDIWYITLVVIDLGLVAVYQEDFHAAQAWYDEGLALARALKDRALEAAALNNLGEVARCRLDVEQAARYYSASLQLHQELGNQPETPRLLHNLGYIALHRGDIARAGSYFQDSLNRFKQLGMWRGIAEGLAGLAAVSAVQGRPVEAARLWGKAEALHEMDGTPVWPSDRREHARYQAVARANLDAAQWDAAWQAGRLNPGASDVEAA